MATSLLSTQSAGAGPAVVLLHAFPLDGRLWRHQIAALAASYRVLAPDLRGFGASRELGGASSIDQMADDVVELLDAQGVTKATLVGLSMGGYVALGVLRRHASRIERLVLCDTRAGADDDKARQGRETNLALLSQKGVEAVVDGMLPKLLGASAPAELRAELRAVATEQPAAAVAGALGAMRDRPDSSAALRMCGAPLLAIVGSEDALAPPSEARAMAELAPGGVVREIEGAGHLSCIERPGAFNEALLGWLGA